MKKTIKDMAVEGRRVLVRVDFNAPLKNGEVADDTRIRAAIPTILHLVRRRAAVILCSHLGRPGGEPRDELRMRPVARRLSELIGQSVRAADGCVGPEAERAARELKPCEVLLLENLRFHPGEEANDPGFAGALSKLADLFVNDAFGTCHRAHASTEAITRHLPSVAGLLLEREIAGLNLIRDDPGHPFVTVLGGAKISDKIDIIRALIERSDVMLIGGGMANTFLKAMGLSVGRSLVEDSGLPAARRFIAQYHEKLVLPVDVVITKEIKEGAGHRTVPSDEVPPDWAIADIGRRTFELFTEQLGEARTVLWNGPVGVFEIDAFATGTLGIARLLGGLPEAKTIVGGGETLAATARAGVAENLTHVSTGGGAFLAFMEGKQLPGLEALSGDDAFAAAREMQEARA